MLLRVFVLLTLLFAATTPSLAETRKVPTISSSDLKSACDKSGGSFSPPSGTGEIDGSYGCSKSDCDGKGGVCVVSCTGNGDCYGSTPRQLTNDQTLLSILQDGDKVYHDPVTGNSQSLVDTGAGADHPPEPVTPADPGPGPLY